MTASPRLRFRLPHWGWFLLATVLLVVGYVGLSVWLQWHREQQVIQKIEGWGGRVTRDTDVPWLRRFVSDDRMKHFKLFERVVCVDLQGIKVTNAEVAHLSRLTKLEKVYLLRTAATDAGLAHLSELTNLEYLYLENTAVTDAGLAHLSRLTKLKVLWLDGTAVTDLGLAHLSRLPNLKELFLKKTAVTDKGIEALKKGLPDCNISRTTITPPLIPGPKDATSLSP